MKTGDERIPDDAHERLRHLRERRVRGHGCGLGKARGTGRRRRDRRATAPGPAAGALSIPPESRHHDDRQSCRGRCPGPARGRRRRVAGRPARRQHAAPRRLRRDGARAHRHRARRARRRHRDPPGAPRRVRTPRAFHRRGVRHKARGAHHARDRRTHPRALPPAADPVDLGASLSLAARRISGGALLGRRHLHAGRAAGPRRACALRRRHQRRGRSPGRRRRRTLHRSRPALAGCGAALCGLRRVARPGGGGPSLGGDAQASHGALRRLPAAGRARRRLPGGGRGRRREARQAPLQYRLVQAGHGRAAEGHADRCLRPLSRGRDSAGPHRPFADRRDQARGGEPPAADARGGDDRLARTVLPDDRGP